MAIAYKSQSAVTNGSVTVAPVLPTGTASGDLVVVFVTTKPDTATIVVPANWTLQVDVAGGGGSTGNGSGPTRGAWLSREYDGVWSMPSISITNGNSSAAIAISYSKSSGNNWAYGASSAVYGVAGTVTAVSAVMGANPGITAGDFVLFGATSMDEAPTWSAQSYTATGISAAGTMTERSDVIETTIGSDVGGMVAQFANPTGTSSAAPTFTATTSVATRGTIALLRLREVAGNITASPSATSSAETFGAPTVSLGSPPASDSYTLDWSETNLGGSAAVLYSRGAILDFVDKPAGATASLSITAFKADSTNVTIAEFSIETTGSSVVTFDYKVSSEANYDKLHIDVDGVSQAEYSGVIPWTSHTGINIASAGVHTISFRYQKDAGSSGNEDRVWIALLNVTNTVTTNDTSISIVTDDLESGSIPSFAVTSTWTNSTSEPIAGTRSLRSPASTAGSGSYDITLTKPASSGYATLGFDYKVSSETGWDKLTIFPEAEAASVPATGNPSTPGAPGWVTYSGTASGRIALILPPAASSVLVRYAKDGGGDAGSDAVWIDNISLPATSGPSTTNAVAVGIASGGALGAPTASTIVTASAVGITTGTVFGSPTVSNPAPAQTATPTGIPSSETFGSSTVTTNLTVTPVGITTAAAVGTPAASTIITSSPVGIASGQAVGSPVVVAPAPNTTAQPSGIASAEALGSPTASADASSSGQANLTFSASGSSRGTAGGSGSLTFSASGAAIALVAPGSGNPLDLPGWKTWLSSDSLPDVGETLSSWGSDVGSTTATVNSGAMVVAANTPNGAKAVVMSGSNYFFLPDPELGAGDGEAWIVVDRDTASTGGEDGLWTLGGNDQASHYYYYPDGKVYELAGAANGQRQSFLPTLDLNQWRVYRVSHSAAEGWQAWVDGVSQKQVSGLTRFWRTDPLLGSSQLGGGSFAKFPGKIAFFAMRDRRSTPAEEEQIYNWIATKTGVGPGTPVGGASSQASISLAASGTLGQGAAGSASVSFTASGSVQTSTSSSASLTLTATGTAHSRAQGSANIALAASGASRTPGAGSGALVLAASGAGQARPSAGSGALVLAASGSTQARTGTSSASITLSAAGDVYSLGSIGGDASISFAAGLNSNAVTGSSAGSGSLTLAAGASSSAPVTASASISLMGAAVGRANATALASFVVSALGIAAAQTTSLASFELEAQGEANGSLSSTASLTLAAIGTVAAQSGLGSATLEITGSNSQTGAQSVGDALLELFSEDTTVAAEISGLASITLNAVEDVGIDVDITVYVGVTTSSAFARGLQVAATDNVNDIVGATVLAEVVTVGDTYSDTVVVGDNSSGAQIGLTEKNRTT